MRTIALTTIEAWRDTARRLLVEGVPPTEIHFATDPSQPELFEEPPTALAVIPPQTGISPRVPKSFLEMAEKVACHRDADRFDLLYRVLWRITHGEPRVLEILTDDDIHRLNKLEKAVRRDAHKMKAFVRFRKVIVGDHEQYIAWHRPDHQIVRLIAPFFARRFPTMHWSILTPDESVDWDQENLTFGPGVPRSQAPAGDELEELWRTYYASIFNPARIKLKAMRKEMPVRYWSTLPETDLIEELLADAPRRVEEMIARQEGFATSASDFLPEERSLDQLRQAAAKCQGCDLFRHATQTVFGEGPANARMMLVGEQPGDSEDLEGKPFVGPAGKILAEALEAAGIDRSEVYVTNAVKHFKFERRGKRRIHEKPDAREMNACRPWIEAEIEQIRPKVIVCLGATAAQSLIGRAFRITQQRGQFVATPFCEATIATYHPSAILRAPTPEMREELKGHLVADLKLAAERLNE